MDFESFKPATQTDQAAGDKLAIISNPTQNQVFAWIPTTLSFPKGELSLAGAVVSFGAKDRISESRVLKKWDDGSIALLQVKAPYFLQPGQKAVQAFGLNATKPVFQFHESITNLIANGQLAYSLRLTCRSAGVALTAYPFTGTWKQLNNDSVSKVFRFRGHFESGLPLVDHPLSYTVYVEVEHLSPIAKLTVVFGNDTLERPVPGGIEVTDFQISATIQNQEAFSPQSLWLGDGQQLAVRCFMNSSTESIYNQTIIAWSRCEMVGLQLYPDHQASRGLLTHQELPNRRFTDAELIAVHNQVEAENNFIVFASPKAHLGFINWNPPSTGDQPDFCAGHPMTKTLQSHSLKLFNRQFLSVYRESFRPSHYWETRNGKPEWCSLVDYPTLFFWSGRPHWHPTWNPEYSAWQARGSILTGDLGGWGGQDNQHMSNAHLRSVYELTGDWYLGELCKSYLSVSFWNFFTKWENEVEAERCGRSMKEAYALAKLFPDTPEGQRLLQAVHEKAVVYDQAVTQNISQFGVAGCAPSNSADPRTNGGQWAQTYPGQTIAIAWQTGLHMEWESLRNGPDLRYLQDFALYFLPDGTPKTLFPFPNPNSFLTGGYHISWWAGWIMLAKQYPTLAGSQFVLEHLTPQVNQFIEPINGLFSDQDRWKAWN